ncbi:hypothetical protein AWB78_07369 [Caballeronia calidae]|uniref:TrbC/VIRB2 family protein n=1 Tax=Caballeronia calidae TaxID=1777139 RepID=A0A158EEC6_9BURK|nr:hypothetical protein [Caballeronia calidae]SAL05225.1 hypothetical protein AWB78_07369 [Caballeronia calidae]
MKRVIDTVRQYLTNTTITTFLMNALRRRSATFATLLLCVPELAFAQASFSTGTSLLQAFAQAIFISWGPYIFMIILGVLVVMVGKGWVPMKGAAIAVVCCFCFFCVPTIVRYLATQAAAQI